MYVFRAVAVIAEYITVGDLIVAYKVEKGEDQLQILGGTSITERYIVVFG